MFVDHAKFTIRSGKGGAGCASFRREKFVELGGPDGGDGGNGGNVYFQAQNNTHTLAFYSGKRLLKAGSGEQGSSRKKHGKKGEDLVLIVPPGTSVIDADSGELLLDMINDGEKKLILKGGKGGLGNVHFKNSVNQAPTYAQPGEPYSELNLRLELKSIADVGLVGFPNVGKSTLISTISNAKPEIANYEFTTITPKLGRVNVGEFDGFIMADIPGIIGGASEGKGLGLAFLKHIERTKILLFMLDLAHPSMDVKEQFAALKTELGKFSSELALRPFAIALTRSDACKNASEILADFAGDFEMKAKLKDDFLLAKSEDDFSNTPASKPFFIAVISAAISHNIDELKYQLFAQISNQNL
ncbi:GTPase ObgE [Campylobacter magnus]|uniref:GTPase ObgE n=1 Tax=Campylobacter magnus TaxID=3026462 RepID=UPI00235F4AFC|nr:GTPase ObgE [Campylobacter magnus]MDD0856210.1 GTPase ObgE [Campylobacter magnus]